MVKKFFIAAFLFMAGACMTSETFAQIFPYEYHTEQLDNGLTYIMIPMESPGLVSYFTVVRTGSRDEYEPGHSGFAHLFEHMMFRGTKNYPGEIYDQMITRIGASGNAYTTDDYTCYYMTVTPEDLEQVIMLESDRFQHLDYDEAVFQTETGAVYGEYRKGRTNPWSVLFEEMHDLAYDRHTYQHTTIGFEEDIKAMPTMYTYSQQFFDRYYRPDNVVIMVVGDIQTGQTSSYIQQYYGGWQPGYTPPQVQPEPPQQAERKGTVEYPGRTLPILDVAFKGPEFSAENKDFAALELMADLAFGENSEIYKQLVIQEQKVEFIQPYYDKNRDPGLVHVLSMIRSEEDIEYVRDLIYTTLERFKNEPVSEEALRNLQSRQTYGFLMDLNTPTDVAHNLARYVAVSGGVGVVDSYFQQMQKVTPDDIRAVAKKYFTEERRSVVVLRGAK